MLFCTCKEKQKRASVGRCVTTRLDCNPVCVRCLCIHRNSKGTAQHRIAEQYNPSQLRSGRAFLSIPLHYLFRLPAILTLLHSSSLTSSLLISLPSTHQQQPPPLPPQQFKSALHLLLHANPFPAYFSIARIPPDLTSGPSSSPSLCVPLVFLRRFPVRSQTTTHPLIVSSETIKHSRSSPRPV